MASDERAAQPPPPEPEWHRLHPASLVFRIGAYARNMLVPAIVIIIFATQSEGWELWLAVFFIPAAAVEVFRYFTLRYRFADDELVIRQGLIFRNERHIPYARIQNIDLVQNPLHRWWKVANVRLETASGREPEAVLKVLSLDGVEEMRGAVFAERPSQDRAVREGEFAGEAEDAGPIEGDLTCPSCGYNLRGLQPGGRCPECGAAIRPVATLVQLSTGELVKLGLITVRGFALVAILFGLGWELNLWERFDIFDWLEGLWKSGGDPSISRLVIGATILFGLLTILLLSVIWTILRMHGFRLERRGDDLRLSGGLWSRVTATIPRRRIQLVTVHETILHRLFDRVSVRVETAGGKRGDGDDEESTFSQKWFVPILPKHDLARVLGEISPGLDVDDVEWRPLAPRAGSRLVRRNLFIAVLLAAGCFLAWQPWGGLALAIFAPYGIWHGVRHARYMACARTERGVVYRSGVLTHKISAATHEKMQVIAQRQNPFDRRWDMASLRVDTAGAGPADHRIDVRYLRAEDAASLARDLFASTEGTTLEV